MANDFGALTDMWMLNPTMFDPTQQSNQFSKFNNAALPFPPTYNVGLAGAPTNAATGQPIQSFLDWHKANPGGTTLNATPAQPAAPPQQQQVQIYDTNGVPLTGQAAAWAAFDPSSNISFGMGGGAGGMGGVTGPGSGFTPQQEQQAQQSHLMFGGAPTAPPQAQPAAPQPSGPPNNWQAALNSLAYPGNPVTQGATVPLQQNYQPAGGVNQAFLQQAQGRPGLNQGFLSALSAIQGRPQQGF